MTNGAYNHGNSRRMNVDVKLTAAEDNLARPPSTPAGLVVLFAVWKEKTEGYWKYLKYTKTYY